MEPSEGGALLSGHLCCYPRAKPQLPHEQLDLFSKHSCFGAFAVGYFEMAFPVSPNSTLLVLVCFVISLPVELGDRGVQ